MNEQLIISLCLLALVVFDAIGDAFRFRGWNIPHHAVESIHVVGWFVIWALFGPDFLPVHVALYILGRVVLFDIVFNIAGGLPIGYVGENSLYDLAVKLWAKWVKQSPANFAFIFRLIAFVFWIGTLIKIL